MHMMSMFAGKAEEISHVGWAVPTLMKPKKGYFL